jgi:N-acyl-D-amino-acid deacylase
MVGELDLLIKKGHLIDGTGNPYYKADIGIANGQIVSIDRSIEPCSARQIIHANGLVVTPGFIDSHSHDDLYLLINPTCDWKILQGVTTVVIGNCGFSGAPLSEAHRSDIEEYLTWMGRKYIPTKYLPIGDFEDFLKKLEALKPGINIIPLIGHSTVRIAVMGSANREPTDSELKRMEDLVARGMEDGAFGISTGLIYPPGNYARTDEIIDLTKVVGRFNGIYASHIRSEGTMVLRAIAEAIKVGEEANLPVNISHHKVIGKNNWGKSVDTLKMIAQARAHGLEVTCDQYPYEAGSTSLSSLLPPTILSEGPSVYSQRLKDPKIRKAVIAEIEKGGEDHWENFINAVGFENIVITVSPNHHDYIGKSIRDIAKMEGKSPYELIIDLIVEEKRETIIILFMMHDQDIERIMRSPFAMIGTDGSMHFGMGRDHPRNTGTFPRVLGRYVREKGVLSLGEAIRKMTSLPAQTFRIKRKGLLKEGFDADIVMFDPKTVIDKSTYEDPKQKPEGISYVLVNGEIAAENGRVTRATSGKVLRFGEW